MLILISEASSSFCVYFLKIGRNKFSPSIIYFGIEFDNNTRVYVAFILILVGYFS